MGGKLQYLGDGLIRSPVWGLYRSGHKIDPNP